MADVEFAFDWIDGSGVQGPELRATWARLELRVKGHSLTTVLDETARTTRDHVYVPLYPLAEWLATHWWSVLHEIETPARSEDTSFVSRHSLRSAREGYALPALSIYPQGESVHLLWRTDELPRHRVRFLTSGSEHVPEPSWRGAIFDLVSAVIGRLRELRVEGTLLEEEWQAIQDAGAEEQEFCAVAAALGLDPFALEEDERERIVHVGEGIPESVRGDFFAVASMSSVEAESKAVLEALSLGEGNPAELHGLKDLRRSLDTVTETAGTGAPWTAGYAIATRVRKLLDLDGQPLASLEDIGRAIRSSADELEAAILSAPPSAPFDAVVGVNDRGSPGFVSAHQGARMRFHLCRGLCEFLTGPGSALLTRAHSWRQARNRAFAAEFLAPAATLASQLSGVVAGEDDVDELAGEFGVPPFVIRHQLENRGVRIW